MRRNFRQNKLAKNEIRKPLPPAFLQRATELDCSGDATCLACLMSKSGLNETIVQWQLNKKFESHCLSKVVPLWFVKSWFNRTFA